MCRKVYDTYYSVSDPYIKCHGQFYSNIIIPLNLIVLIYFIVIIPCILSNKLYNKYKKNEFYISANLRIYGIFYNELNINYYYWDFILMQIVIIL